MPAPAPQTEVPTVEPKEIKESLKVLIGSKGILGKREQFWEAPKILGKALEKQQRMMSGITRVQGKTRMGI